MFSLTISSLSPCSFAISWRMGATWRHGPHHSAQNSTSTGLSLLRTSVSNVASVTAFTVRSLLLVVGQPALGVERGGTAGAGRGDGLAVGVVDDVAGREHAVDVGGGRRRGDLDVPVLVELDLALDQVGARV